MISRYTILYQISNYLRNSSWFSYLYPISFGGWCLLFGSACQVRTQGQPRLCGPLAYQSVVKLNPYPKLIIFIAFALNIERIVGLLIENSKESGL